MSEISFDEEATLVRSAPLAAQQPALVKLVIRWGLAKDPKGAQLLLVLVTVISVVLAVAIPLMLTKHEVPPPNLMMPPGTS
jgi:hypothetical protein